MKTTVDLRADLDGNIVEITTNTYTPQEWLSRASDVYKFACEMSAGYRPRTANLLETDNVKGQTI